MPNQTHIEILARGVEHWNKWREENPTIIPNLMEAHLPEANLSGVDFREANLNGAWLPDADLSNADLSGATLTSIYAQMASFADATLDGARGRFGDFTGADLRASSLRSVNFPQADLTGAQLGNADFSYADLDHTFLGFLDATRSSFKQTSLRFAHIIDVDLTEANLTGTLLYHTVFSDVNLSVARGLFACEHEGPSTLDHSTLMKSKQLPITFLRGCGLPETMIEYLPSLRSEPIQYYSCFISYSTRDQDFADRLHADLQDNGVRCWFAPHNIQGGKKVHEQIDEAIRVYDRLLLILSPASMNSPWVKTEIAHARQKEVSQKRRVLFPITLVPFDDIKAWKQFNTDIGEDSAREIREYFIPDFTDWKQYDAYNKAFERLLRDLKAS